MSMKRLIAVVIAALIAHVHPAKARVPESPVSVRIVAPVTVDAEPRPQVRASLEIDTNQPMDVRVRVFVTATNGNPVSSAWVLDRTISVDKRSSIVAEVPVGGAGDFEVSVIAEPAGGGVSSSSLAYVRLGENGEIQLLSPGEYSTIRGHERAATQPGYGLQPHGGRPGAPLAAEFERERMELLAPQGPDDSGARAHLPLLDIGGGRTSAVRAEKTAALAPLYQGAKLHLTGRITAVNYGVEVPLPNTVVQVWDSDSITPDDLLGTTTTDDAGYYDITFDNTDGPFGGGVDVYLYVSSNLQNAISVRRDFKDSQTGQAIPIYYAWRSETVDDIREPNETINLSITDNPRAALIWGAANRALHLARTLTGKTFPKMSILYPGSEPGTFHRPGHINIDSSKGDSMFIVGHEYGHEVMFQAQGDSPADAYGGHSTCNPATAAMSWSEGFATFYGLLTQNTGPVAHWHAGDAGVDIEHWSCTLHDMDSDELRSAAALWDLYDRNNDDNDHTPDRGATGYSDHNSNDEVVGAQTIIKALWLSKQNVVSDYWKALRPTLTAVQQPTADEIFRYNYYLHDIK